MKKTKSNTPIQKNSGIYCIFTIYYYIILYILPYITTYITTYSNI